MLRENSNLRAALKTVERMKMEVENEKVAVQDQVRYEAWMCAQHTHMHARTYTHTRTRTHTHTGRVLCIALLNAANYCHMCVLVTLTERMKQEIGCHIWDGIDNTCTLFI